ncbi:MAG TPA: hypothetical protein PKH58_13565, partial [Paludibacteraceae bacterium]|nr:hypothetical protein [Paludibacteraceae bacterium]
MKYSTLSKSLMAKILVFIAICAVPFVANYFDNNRDLKRKQYERHLLDIARSAAAKDMCEKSGEAEADSPDMAALQEFFMTADPALDRVPAERLFAAKQ